MSQKAVSVIIPVYNEEKRIKRCIESVQLQTLKDIEIIIVDDGSTDSSGKICDDIASRDDRICVIHTKNRGISAARNVGLSHSTGKFIGFIDADDYYDKSILKEMYDIAFEKDIDVVNCNYYGCNDEGDRLEEYETPILPKDRIIYHDEMREYIGQAEKNKFLWFVWRNLYRSQLIKENNISFIEGPIIEDTPFNMEAMYCASSMYCINKALYFYVNNETSTMREEYKPLFEEKIENLYYEKIKFYEKHGYVSKLVPLANYTINHSLKVILDKVTSADGKKAVIIKKIRNGKMMKEAFVNYTNIEGSLKTKIKVKLIQYRLIWIYLFLVNISSK